MSTFTDHVVNLAAEHGVAVNFGGRIANVNPANGYDCHVGPYGGAVTEFDADDLAALIRIVYANGDHLPNVTNADGTPVPSPLVAHGVRPSTITAEEIHRLAGGEYRARVVAMVDDYPREDFGPGEGMAVSMATFSAGRDYIGGGTWEYEDVRVDAEGATLTADKVREIHDEAAPWRSGTYAAFRALTYSGARGIHTVGSFDGSQAHISYVHHPKGTPDHWLGYDDALAWVPAEFIAEYYPGTVTYSPATGWVDADGTSAEAEVERWCARMVAGQMETMDHIVRGDVYVVSVEDAVITAEDDEDDPDWEHLDSCGGYIGDDADPTVYTSGAFYLLVEAVVTSLAKGAEMAAKLADQAARHAEWREATDPREYALAREILGHHLPYVFSDADLDAALDRQGLRLIFTHDGHPAVMTTDEI